jgi:branched-subunit amino acid permease
MKGLLILIYPLIVNFVFITFNRSHINKIKEGTNFLIFVSED